MEESYKLRRELYSLQEETRHEEKQNFLGWTIKQHLQAFQMATQFNQRPHGKDKTKDMDVKPFFRP